MDANKNIEKKLELAKNNKAWRLVMASARHTEEAVLCYLSEIGEPEVLLRLIGNPSIPKQILLKLAQSEDQQISQSAKDKLEKLPADEKEV